MTLIHLGLNHENTLTSKLFKKLVYIEVFFHLHSLQHAVQDDECSGPAHPSTAVNQ